MADRISSVNHSDFYNIHSRGTAESKKSDAARQPSDSVVLGNNDSVLPEAGGKKWTVLFYSAADNNLEEDLVNDAIELEGIGSNENMDVVLQIDRGKKPSEISGGWAGCRRYHLVGDGDPSKINSPVLADLGQVNMSDPKVLADFITWGIKNYPAENYMLLVSDHGAGWPGACEDVSHNGWMSTPQIREALETAQKATGEKIDVLGFDACLMASTEVAHELKDSVDYMVASQNIEGVEGWPYSKIFKSGVVEKLQQALNTRFNLSPEDVAKKIVADSEGFPSIDTLSAFDLSKAKELTAATDNFAKLMLKTDVPMETIRNIAAETKTFYGYKDQYDFAERIIGSADIKDEKLKDAARDMISSIQKLVIAEYHSKEFEGSHGVSLEISPNGGRKSNYKHLMLAKETKWDEAMHRMTEGMDEDDIAQLPMDPFDGL